MAKNWTLAQATKEIFSKKPQNTYVMEIARRYPVLSTYLQKMATVQENMGTTCISDFLEVFPDYVTCLKINKFLIGGANDKVDEEYDPDEEEPKRKKKGEPVKTKKSDDDEDDEDDFDEEVEEVDEEEEAAGKYDKMTAIELYKECKKRKIKAETQKPQKYYIQLLEKDDKAKEKQKAKAAKAKDAEEAEEDWEEEDKKKAKPNKKAAKKVEDDEDEEEWDF